MKILNTNKISCKISNLGSENTVPQPNCVRQTKKKDQVGLNEVIVNESTVFHRTNK